MRETRTRAFSATALVVILLATRPGAEMLFTDVTASANILHFHSHPNLSDYWHEDFSWMTGGVVAEDFDGDGWIDLYCLQGGSSPNLLYLNQGDGTFQEEASARGVALTGPHVGTCAADYDNDGDIDLFISSSIAPHFLFLNDSNGNFSLSPETFEQPAIGASSPSWGNLNNEGLLDLALGAWNSEGKGDLKIYLQPSPGQFELYQSLNNDFSFTPSWGNFDTDRNQDIFLVADFGNARLYQNRQSLLYPTSTTSDVQFGMGSAVGDIDSDGDLDIFITSVKGIETERTNWGRANGNRLLINQGNGTFDNVTEIAGVGDGSWGWGTVFEDFDNDGDLDIYHVNGWPGATLGLAEQFNEQPARLFENLGNLQFQDVADVSGDAANAGQGRCVVAFDYDRDGDQDLFIANNSTLTFEGEVGTLGPGPPVLLRNDTPSSNHWLNVHLQGNTTPHHSQGIGARVYATTGSLTQMRELNASSGYIGHGPNRIAHFGLGSAATCDIVRAVWTNGDETEWHNVSAGQSVTLASPQATVSQRTLDLGESLTASLAPAKLPPGSTATWTIEGASFSNPATVILNSPGEHLLQVTITDPAEEFLWSESLLVAIIPPGVTGRSIARQWNEQILSAIRLDFPNPTIHSRNLYHLSLAMWDVWTACETTASAVIHQERHSPEDLRAFRQEAISYAAYRILSERYASSPNSSTSLASFNGLMAELNFDPIDTSLLGNSPAAFGNRVANSVLSYFANDNADNFASHLGASYLPSNPPLPVVDRGTTMLNPNRWQPLQFEVATTQNGQTTSLTQTALGSHWGAVRPFALPSLFGKPLHLDPGTPPLLGASSDLAFKNDNIVVLTSSHLLDSAVSNPIDISPASRGANSLGQNDGEGHPLNPVTGLPYQPEVVNHADYGRVLAEFWADGPDSETPPGHWNVLANKVADSPGFSRKLAGQGPELSALEWDVKIYLALNGALHDAAIAAWGCKRVYDYVRPISSIRYMGGLGQSSAPLQPSYHQMGLPLVPGLVELVTAASSSPGNRHAHLSDSLNQITVHCWSNQTTPPGVSWILATDWLPYQRDTFVTPAFPGYVSGHSTFSRAAAEVMTQATGTSYFPGGLGTFTAKKDTYLEFDNGPSEELVLQWATYFDAADEAGLSRLYGGIHFPADDGPGRIIGSQCGLLAWELARKYFDGSIHQATIEASLHSSPTDRYFSWNTIRGFRYRVQQSESLSPPNFIDQGSWITAEETVQSFPLPLAGAPAAFFRVYREMEAK